MDQIRYLSVRLDIKRTNDEHESIGSGVIWNPKESIYTYILTAAHVVEPYLKDEVIFNVSYYDINEQQVTVSVDKENIALHPQYGLKTVNGLKSNDVAVMRCNRFHTSPIEYKFYNSNTLDHNSNLMFYGFPKKHECSGFSHNITKYTGIFQHTLNKEEFKYKFDLNNALDILEKNDDLLGVSGSGIFLNNHDKFILIGIHTNGLGKNMDMNLAIGMNICLVQDICSEKEWDIPQIEHHKLVKSDTLQILNVYDFIQEYDSNELAAPLDNNFHFRENEVSDLMSFIEDNKVTVLYGQAGVGKTRIAIEVIKRLYDTDRYKILCIRSKDLPIFDDLRLNISTPGNYLIFIDDANELNNLNHILNYLNNANGYSVKIILTVRDYAKKRVIQKIQEFTNPKMIELKIFTNDEIELLMKENLNIKNSLYLNQICDISKGNPRIAYLAGKLAKDKQSLKSIKDVSQLYKLYYAKYFKETSSLENKKLYLTAGIISLLKIINLEHCHNIQELLDLFNLSQDEFKENLYTLHKIEFLSISFDKVVKISDQCLSNYMIYYVFFIKRPLPFSKVLNIGFKYFRSDVIDSINMLRNIFHSEAVDDYLNEQINITWDIYKTENEKIFFEYLKVFHIFRQEESLIYINNLITNMESDNIDLSKVDFEKNQHYSTDEFLPILGDFSYSDYESEAIEIILYYYEKHPMIGGMVTEILTNNYGINNNYYTDDYNQVNRMLDTLLNKCNNHQLIELLLINIAKHLLQLNIKLTKFKKNTFMWGETIIKLTDSSKKYRSRLWKKLIELSKHNKYQQRILNLLISYLNSLYKEINTRVFEFDLMYVKSIIENIKSTNNLEISKICNRILDHCKDYSIEFDSIFENIIQNKEYEIYLLLAEDYSEKYSTYDEYELVRKNNIRHYAQSLDLSDLESHIIIFNNILNQLPKEEYRITQGIDIFIDSLNDNKEKYLKCLQLCIEKIECFRVFPKLIIQQLLYFLGVNATFNFINSYEFTQKNEWNFVFFQSLEVNVINEYWTNAFLDYLNDDSDKLITQSTFRNLNFLDKYILIDPNIYIKATTIINKKISSNPFIAKIYLIPFFEKNNNSPSKLLNIFKDDLNLLKEIYFKLLLSDSQTDYNGYFIKNFIEKDKSWLKSYTKYIIENIDSINRYKTDRISACWSNSDYKLIFDEIFYQINATEDATLLWDFKYFLINTFTNEKGDLVQYSNQLNWLKSIILENYTNSKIHYIFEIILKLSDDIAIECIIYFLKLNDDYNVFKSFPFQCYPNSWSGSLVPYLEQKIKFYESILTNITGINFLHHKQYIKKEIDFLKDLIIKEQIDEIIEEKYH